MMGVTLRVSPTVPELNCASPGFHVKHVDTELSVIAEACGQRRTLGWPRWNGGGFMTCQNVGCRDNRAAGWALPGTVVKYARGPTNASRHSPSGLTWGGVGIGLYPPPCDSVLESRAGKGRCGRPPGGNAVPGHHEPAGSIKPAARCPQR